MIKKEFLERRRAEWQQRVEHCQQKLDEINKRKSSLNSPDLIALHEHMLKEAQGMVVQMDEALANLTIGVRVK